MDLTLIKLAIERLAEEVTALKKHVAQQQEEIKLLRRERQQYPENIQKETKPTFEPLLTNREVSQILHIGKNSLIKLVREGAIKQIRINQRGIRYSRESILSYLDSLNDQKQSHDTH